MSVKRNLIILTGSAFLLSACGTAKNALGLDRNNPDEHTVMEREPLTLPPNFNEMPQPEPGAQRPQEESPNDKVQKALLGKKAQKKNVKKSAAEEALLKNAGTADDNIRTTVNKEAHAEQAEASFVKKFVGMDDEKSGKVIDADAEYEKIHGKPHPNKDV